MTEQELLSSYTVKESRFGLFTSYKPDGEAMVTSATEKECRFATEMIHIPSLFGTFTGTTSVGSEAFVGGKL